MQTTIPFFLLIPFVTLLVMIATGPVLYHHFWERYYSWVAAGLATLVVGYYIFVLHDMASPIEAFADYFQFIALITALYITAGGILIEVKKQSSVWHNLALLWAGALLSNLVGTTGASMLLIRPYMRMNKRNIAPYHIVFFIFMVSNLGGVLTAVGDPPLLLGFLKGVPFLWTLRHGFLPWVLALGILSVIFYYLDRHQHVASEEPKQKGRIHIEGKRNILLLFLIACTVLLDPNIIPTLPTIPYHGHRYSFVREFLMLGIALLAYQKNNPAIVKQNGFNLAPLKEVACIFIGIFGTMIPAIQLIQSWACHPEATRWVTPHFLYWVTGLLSSALDNAPTYLNFLAAGMSAKCLSMDQVEDVVTYAKLFVPYLKATSLGAVFFGAMSYVGNGPNFMVKAIAEEQGVKMPSFNGYIKSFAIPYLLPVLIVVWVVFFLV